MLHLSLSALLLLLAITATSSSPDPHLFSNCSGENYSSPSAYESNLRIVLSNLTANIGNSSSLFATATLGDDPSSKVFALAECRPDIPPDYCADCIRSSAATATIGCPLRRSATVRYDFCILRYSDRDFFGIADYEIIVVLRNTENATDPEPFGRAAGAVMWRVAMKAAEKAEKVAVGMASYDDAGERSVYAMAWCTRDLSTGDCLDCLQLAVHALELKTIGEQVLGISCALRLETSSFSSMFLMSPEITRADTSVVAGNGECRTMISTVLIIVSSVVVALALN